MVELKAGKSGIYRTKPAELQSVYGRIERTKSEVKSKLIRRLQSVYGRIERAAELLETLT